MKRVSLGIYLACLVGVTYAIHELAKLAQIEDIFDIGEDDEPN